MLFLPRMVEESGDKIAVGGNSLSADWTGTYKSAFNFGIAMRTSHHNHTLVGNVHRTENLGRKVVAFRKRSIADGTAHKVYTPMLIFLSTQVFPLPSSLGQMIFLPIQAECKDNQRKGKNNSYPYKRIKHNTVYYTILYDIIAKKTKKSPELSGPQHYKIMNHIRAPGHDRGFAKVLSLPHTKIL